MPVQPRPAATVILVRDGRPGLEVLLLKRTSKTRFGPGASVFPGGAVDSSDGGTERPPCELDETTANGELRVSEGGLAYRFAAIRECFEEAGILLASHTDGRPLDLSAPDASRRFETYREEMRRQRIGLADLCREEGLQLYGQDLHYVSHWVTPAYVPKRFDTRFFLAVTPPGQMATCCGTETVDETWITPEAGLRADSEGKLELMTPTRDTLERLRPYPTAEALVSDLAARRGRQDEDGRTIPDHGLLDQRFPDPAWR